MISIEHLLIGAVILMLCMNLIAFVWLWNRDDRLSQRLTVVEANQANAPTHRDMIDIRDRLTSVQAQTMTLVQLMQSIQQFLLEQVKESP